MPIGPVPIGVVGGVAVQPVTSWALQAVVSTRAKSACSSSLLLVTNKVRVRGSTSSGPGALTGAIARLAQSCWLLALQVRASSTLTVLSMKLLTYRVWVFASSATFPERCPTSTVGAA